MKCLSHDSGWREGILDEVGNDAKDEYSSYLDNVVKRNIDSFVKFNTYEDRLDELKLSVVLK